VSLATVFIRLFNLSLRTSDAPHIAIAQRLDATPVTFDRMIAAAASALGIPVETP